MARPKGWLGDCSRVLASRKGTSLTSTRGVGRAETFSLRVGALADKSEKSEQDLRLRSVYILIY